jgi:hypothetical protein
MRFFSVGSAAMPVVVQGKHRGQIHERPKYRNMGSNPDISQKYKQRSGQHTLLSSPQKNVKKYWNGEQQNLIFDYLFLCQFPMLSHQFVLGFCSFFDLPEKFPIHGGRSFRFPPCRKVLSVTEVSPF